MNKEYRKYTFYDIHECNMCNAGQERFKILGKRLDKTQGFRPHLKTGITTSVMKCQNCGLIFSNPLPIPENLSDHYEIDPATYWKEDYFNISQDYFKNEIEWLQRLRPFSEGQKTLDVGSGIGKQMISLNNEGYQAYGIEASKSFYRIAIDKMGISNEYLFNNSLEDAKFEDNYFDFISFGAVLEHLYNPAESIKKVMKWLKPNGLIHIEVPNSNWFISRFLNKQYKLRGLDYVTNLSPMHPPFHLYEFDINSFKMNGAILEYAIKDFDYYVCRKSVV